MLYLYLSLDALGSCNYQQYLPSNNPTFDELFLPHLGRVAWATLWVAPSSPGENLMLHSHFW